MYRSGQPHWLCPLAAGTELMHGQCSSTTPRWDPLEAHLLHDFPSWDIQPHKGPVPLSAANSFALTLLSSATDLISMGKWASPSPAHFSSLPCFLIPRCPLYKASPAGNEEGPVFPDKIPVQTGPEEIGQSMTWRREFWTSPVVQGKSLEAVLL